MKPLSLIFTLTTLLCVFPLSSCSKEVVAETKPDVTIPQSPPPIPSQDEILSMDFEEVLTVFLSATLGTPYHYGGDTPMEGYDCSGFVMEYLKMWGIAPPTDSSSDMIYDWFQADQRRFQHYKPGVGALVFYGKKSPDGRSIARISHIALMINDHQIAEAGGGDQRTLSKQEAINKKAFVRIRPYQYRKDMLITIMPTYPEWAKHPGRLRSPIVRNCPVNSSCVTDDQLLLPWYY